MNLFPASLLDHLLPKLWARFEALVQQRQRTNAKSFELQWWLVKVHQSPAPTHPLSRVSLSQWKLLASEWEAGLSSEKKKKKSNYSLLPLSCHYWKLASAQSAPHLFLCQVALWLSRTADRRNGGQTNPCTWNQSFTMTAKNTAKARACAVQTSTGTARRGWALKICSPGLQEISKRS